MKIRPILRTLQWYKAFFSQEGRYPGYRHTQRNTLIHSKWKERGKRKVIWCNRHIDIYPLRQKGKSTRHANHTAGGKAQSYGGQAENPTRRAGKTWWDTQIIWRAARPSQGTSRDPHPGGQRPSPARAPTRTSRRAGISQGDLPHTKVTTSSLRMQGDRKEQHSSHSLNQWKERFDLWHRHAGMLTGSEPHKLRGILNKEPRSLMTRFGPSPERGPGTQPTK